MGDSELRDEFGILHPIVKDGKSLFYNTNEKTKFRQIYRKKIDTYIDESYEQIFH